MKFEEAFFDELEKIALTLPQTPVRRVGDAGLRAATMRQPAIKWLHGYGRSALKGTPGGPKNVSRSMHDKIKSINPAGTVAPDMRTGKNTIYLHKKLNMKDNAGLSGLTRRGTLAHESYHANKPILGKSETLAHLAGGFHNNRNSSVGSKVKDMAKQYGHLWRTRPARAGLEHAAVAAGAYGAYRLGKKVFGKKKDKKDE